MWTTIDQGWIGGLETYVAEPEDRSNAKVVVFLVDSKQQS
jgi:hypothetical protein